MRYISYLRRTNEEHDVSIFSLLSRQFAAHPDTSSLLRSSNGLDLFEADGRCSYRFSNWLYTPCWKFVTKVYMCVCVCACVVYCFLLFLHRDRKCHMITSTIHLKHIQFIMSSLLCNYTLSIYYSTPYI